MTKNNEKQAENNGSQLITIEELAKAQRTPTHIFSAVCTRNNWGAGKAVTESEYEKEVEIFMKSPIGRRN